MAAKERKYIKIRGANEHNLKRYRCGHSKRRVCGADRSFRFAENHPLRLIRSMRKGRDVIWSRLSSYARQFLGQMEKPNVEKIEGLSPAISIDQKSTNRNPRSTVGTVTEIYDYFRLLYAQYRYPALSEVWQGDHASRPWIRWWIRSWRMPEGTKIQLLAPVVRGQKG